MSECNGNMVQWQYIVKKEFAELIAVNAWLDDFVYYISACTEPDFIDTIDMQDRYYRKALECLDKWVHYNKYLPKDTVQRIANTLKYLAELAIVFANEESEEIELAEILRSISDLAEFARIVSIISVWEKVREKYMDVSIDHTIA